MEVTEKYLSDIGGWQAMKVAREYVRTSSVSEVQRDGNQFRGLMQVQGRKMRVTLDIKDARRIDAKCACREAQQGLICAHALAVALASLQSARPELKLSSASSQPKSEAALKPATPSPADNLSKIPGGELEFYLSMDQWQRLPSGSVPIFVKFTAKKDSKELKVGPWLLDQGIPFRSGGFRLTGAQLATFLPLLLEHPRVYMGSPKETQAIAMTLADGAKIPSKVSQSKGGYQFSLLNPELQFFEMGPHIWIWNSSQRLLGLASISSVDDSAAWLSFLRELGAKKHVQKSQDWVIQNLLSLKEALKVDSESEFNKIRLMPHNPQFILQLDGNFKGLRTQLWVQLKDSRYVAASAQDDPHFPIQDPEEPSLFYVRNLSWEQSALERLQRYGFTWNSLGYWELRGEKEVLEFYSSKLDRLSAEFPLEEGDQWKLAKRGILPIKPRVATTEAGAASAGTGEDWLSLEVDYIAPDGFRIPRNEVLRLIRSGKRDLNAGNGKRYLLDIDGCEEFEESLQDADGQLQSNGRIALKANHLAVLGDYVKDRRILIKGDPASHRLKPDEVIQSLGKVGSILRPYQLDGVAWLESLSRFAGGGILADEMGLGKTLQTLSFLSLIKAKAGENTKPTLIICPTSLLSNWKDEAEKFVPHLKVHVSHEAGRKKYLESLEQFDVVLTSYALIVRDLEAFQKLEFDAVILDEASYIRNPDTESAKAVKSLKAKARFALTGTPVENGVRDLWSIFQFTLPRYLPSQDKFHERFVKPLQSAQGGDSESTRVIMQRLKRLVNPYLLRRTKREVAKELPDKIEKVLYAELTPVQKEVYQRLLEEGRQEIRDARKRSGKGAARMTMFTILLRLRQVCNDLRLLKQDSLKEQIGGKWEVLEETFTELIEGGHKAIIFSQFVGMLHLLREKLDQLGISYSYLDGASKDRAEQVSAFQKEKRTQFFLISLKAGGYGLTLTEADHVMLVDPWWNPAVEAQAIDRAHRIGQERPVTAYRVIARGTVEEKILKLQAAKRQIIDLALEDDPAVMSGVSDEELEALFED